MLKSKKYLITVVVVNFLAFWGFPLVLLSQIISANRLPEPVYLTLIFLPVIIILGFNIASIAYAVMKLRPPDLYARVGFWLSVLILIFSVVPLFIN